MSTILTPLVIAALATFAGAFIIESTRHTRGFGSWAEDRARTMLAGALYLVALVGYSIAIANAIAP